MLSRHSILSYIFVVSLCAMLGSLYFSNFGDPIKNRQLGHFFLGTGFEPCHLCRWTRILMYPLVWISGISLIRKDYKIVYTILPVSLMGMMLSGYHYTIQHINSLNAFSCNPNNPCTLIDWKRGSYITIPGLACIAFTLIVIISIVLIQKMRKEER